MRHLLCVMVAAAALLGGETPGQTPPGKKDEEPKKSNVRVGGKSLYEWMDDLKSRDPAVREMAISTIKLYGSAARDAVPALIKGMADSDVALRVNAIIAIGFIGMEPQDVPTGVTALTRALTDSQGIVRFQAAMALGRLGVDAKTAVAALVNTIRDPSSWEIRQAGAYALGTAAVDRQLGPDMRAIKALLAALSDNAWRVRLESVLSLITLGAPANNADRMNALNVLQQLLTNDRNLVVKIWARMAIMRMDKIAETHVKAIGSLLKYSDPEVRLNAARALATIGPEAKSQVPYLMSALDDKDLGVLYWVIVALAQMGDAATPALSALIELKQHKDEGIKRAADEAVDKIKNKPRK